MRKSDIPQKYENYRIHQKYFIYLYIRYFKTNKFKIRHRSNISYKFYLNFKTA